MRVHHDGDVYICPTDVAVAEEPHSHVSQHNCRVVTIEGKLREASGDPETK